MRFLSILALALAACTTTPQTTKGELGQGSTHATAAMFKSAATTDNSATLSPEGQALGSKVEAPFALWNPDKKAWDIPLDKDGKPFLVTASAVRDFNYIVAGTVSNSSTISGTASGQQTQGQTASPQTTVSPQTSVSIPAK